MPVGDSPTFGARVAPPALDLGTESAVGEDVTRLGPVGRIRDRWRRQVTEAVGWGWRPPGAQQVVPPRPLPRGAPKRVSVIVTCFNYGRYLAECTRSVLEQPAVDVELVIVDDASDDGSARVVSALAESDSRINCVLRSSNGGPVVAFNQGLERATGDYMVRLDADDLLAPGALGRAVALMEHHPGVGLVYGRPRHFSGTVPSMRGSAHSWTIWSGRQWLALRCERAVNCITSPEVVMRAEEVRSLGGQHPSLPHTHDFEMWLRMAAQADIARVNGVDQAFHRDHAKSRMATVMTGHLVDLHERRRAFDVLFSGPAGDLVEAHALRQRAAVALAEEALDRASRAYDRGRVATEPVEDYITFAVETYPAVRTLSAWTALERRRQRASGSPARTAAALRRRAAEEVARVRWQWTGL